MHTKINVNLSAAWFPASALEEVCGAVSDLHTEIVCRFNIILSSFKLGRFDFIQM